MRSLIDGEDSMAGCEVADAAEVRDAAVDDVVGAVTEVQGSVGGCGGVGWGLADSPPGTQRQASMAGCEPELRSGKWDREEAASGGPVEKDLTGGLFFRPLVDNSQDIISVVDGSGLIVYANPAATAILGFRSEELVGRSPLEFIHPEDQRRVGELLGELAKKPGSTTFSECRVRGRDGSWHHLEFMGKNLLDDPAVGGMIFNLRDATRRKEAEAALHESEERFRSSFESAAIGMALVSPEGRWLKVNRALCEILGYSEKQLQEMDFQSITHPDDLEADLAFVQQMLTGEVRTYQMEKRYLHRDGGVVWVHLSVSLVRDSQGRALHFISQIQDITRRVLDQQQLRLQSTALSAAANAIFITDREGRFQWANAAFCRLSGYELDELGGQTPRIVKSGEQNDEYYERLWQTILAGQVWSGEVVERRKSGELYTVHQTITPLRDGDGQITHFIAVHEDITARKDAEARIERMAFSDALTGLPNRVELNNRLVQAIARAKRSDRLVALHYVDLDRFKVVNDTLGHAVGDALLQAVAGRLQSCLRASDTVARLGGDEFAILQTDLPRPQGAAVLASKVLRVMSPAFRLANRDIHMSPSIGVTIFPEDGGEPAELLQNADMAMYFAKKEGRNNFQFFTAALNAQVRERMALETDLHRALERREFVLHYQPQVDLRTRRLVGVEALIRWQHPERGLIFPAAFIGLAEECGLIHGITRWVLEEACAQNAAWQAAGLPQRRMAVNISTASFMRGDLCQSLAEVLEQTHLPAEFLELEVTETVLLQDEQVAAVMPGLKKMGIALSIDDFGTGYSSLSYLRRLQVNKLKIDQSFVRGLPESLDDAIIASAIIDLGHALGQRVIAEGIESAEQLAFLCGEGCDEGQGFLFGPPVSAEAFAELLKQEAMAGEPVFR